MRKGRRKLLAALGLFLFGTVVAAAPPMPPSSPPSPGPAATPVRLTIEVAWKVPPLPSTPAGDDAGLDLELSEGRVIDAMAWPSTTRGGPRRLGRGWRLGHEPSGR